MYTRANLPFPDAIYLRTHGGIELVSMGIPVPPIDHRGQAFIVDGERRWASSSGTIFFLDRRERAPFRALINFLFLDDKSAIGANSLATGWIDRNLCRMAFRAFYLVAFSLDLVIHNYVSPRVI